MYVNLYLSNTADLKVGGHKITVEQTSDYPWNGEVSLTLRKGGGDFDMRLRIPGWVRNQVLPGGLYVYADSLKPSYTVSVNGEPVESHLENGYFVISRKWKKNDVVRLSLDMHPRLVKANDKVEAGAVTRAVEQAAGTRSVHGFQYPPQIHRGRPL